MSETISPLDYGDILNRIDSWFIKQSSDFEIYERFGVGNCLDLDMSDLLIKMDNMLPYLCEYELEEALEKVNIIMNNYGV